MRLKRIASWFGVALLLSAAPFSLSARRKGPRKASSTPHTISSDTSTTFADAAGRKGSKRTSAKKRRRRRRERGQKAPTADRIREIQSALAREGVYQGEPSGKWDAASVEGMKRFQQAHGLTPTGKFDALSLQKLGLGSEVAGRAAPRPPAQALPATVVRQ